jgi:hypothetical protein
MLVGVCESVAVMRYGSNGRNPADGTDGRLTPVERNMLVNGLTGSMVSLPQEVTQQIASLSAPCMAALGLLFYMARLSNLERARRANAAETDRANAVTAAESILNTENGNPFQGSNGRPDFVPPSKDTLMDQFGG